MKNINFKSAILVLSLVGISLQASAQKKSELVKNLEKDAYAAYMNKEYTKAIESLQHLDTMPSKVAPMYDYWMGMCLLSTDNKAAAIPYLESAKKSDMTSFVVNYYLGRAYLYQGRVEEASKHLGLYAREYLSRGIKFERSEEPVSEAHRVHVEKTLNDVYALLAKCEIEIENRKLTSIK